MPTNLKFGSSQNLGVIQEQRDFTNPHVRFIRKGGRIIPIYNKKRIGQDISEVGWKGLKIGAALGALALAKKTRLGGPIAKALNFSISKIGHFSSKIKVNPKTLTGKAALGVTKTSFKVADKIWKNTGKAAIAVGTAGAFAKVMGDEMQMRSGFGKDFAFVTDEHGRGA